MDYTPDSCRSLADELTIPHSGVTPYDVTMFLRDIASAWEADRKRPERLEDANRVEELLGEVLMRRNLNPWFIDLSEGLMRLMPSDTSQANPSHKSPAGTDILRTRVCPECESVIQSGINRCPHCSGE